MLKKVVVGAVEKAGRMALRRIDDLGKIKAKSSKDFVTEVDEEIEKLIIKTIRLKFPHSAFLGEESGRQGGGKYLFVIDPIDATTNYARKIPFFDVAVSVYENGQGILGVIACPKLNELYIGEKGRGAFLNGKKIKVSGVNNIEQAMVSFNRSYYAPEIIEPAKKTLSVILEQAATFRAMGTGSLDYCYLARGSFDACITPLAEPFHSAGYIIMEEAGAKVTDYRDRPHQLESKTIVAANPALHPKILNLVSGSTKKQPYTLKKSLQFLGKP